MENHILIMKQSLDLSETILEGLHHIQTLLIEGKANQTIFLFEDILIAYSTIERTVEPAITELNNQTIPSLQSDLNTTADLIVTAYEEQNYAKVQEILQFTFVPQFKKFKEELEKAFYPYLVS